MKSNRSVGLIIILVLIVGNFYFGFKYYEAASQVAKSEAANSVQKQESQKVTSFLKLFVNKVLQAKGEVSFDDRLMLENAVRDLNDKDILGKWQAFVNSSDDVSAQKNLKDLLQLLVEKLNG